MALTTGTPTALPERYVTATPTLVPVYVVATATPEDVIALMDRLRAGTVEATTTGTPTPLPRMPRSSLPPRLSSWWLPRRLPPTMPRRRPSMSGPSGSPPPWR